MKITCKKVQMADGRFMLREFYLDGRPYSTASLPQESDVDTILPSRKHQGKTIGEIEKIDREYLLWCLRESKLGDRFKKSIARALSGNPYVPPKEGDIYDEIYAYNPQSAYDYMQTLVKNT